MRAKTSSAEPAGKVTTILTGRIGQFCGNATFGDNASAAAPAARCRNHRGGNFILALSFASSFDYLVGDCEQRRRHVQAEGFNSLQIDDEIKLGRLHYRQIAWFLTLENPAGVDADLAICIPKVRAIAHQPTYGDKVAPIVNSGNGMMSHYGDQFFTLAVE